MTGYINGIDLFPDAEIPKNILQDVGVGDGAGDGAEGAGGEAEVFGDEIGGEGRGQGGTGVGEVDGGFGLVDYYVVSLPYYHSLEQSQSKQKFLIPFTPERMARIVPGTSLGCSSHIRLFWVVYFLFDLYKVGY